MEIKKGQFAVFDLLLMLVFIFSTYFVFQQELDGISLDQNRNYDESQLLLFLSNQEEFLTLVYAEDLSSSITVEDWSSVFLSTSIYEEDIYLKLGNISHSKYIFLCDAQRNLVITRNFFIDNSSLKLRFVEFGVCR
jgi:hypothetical protein